MSWATISMACMRGSQSHDALGPQAMHCRKFRGHDMNFRDPFKCYFLMRQLGASSSVKRIFA